MPIAETTNEKTTVILTTPAATVPTTSERQRITNANIPSPHLTTTSSEGLLNANIDTSTIIIKCIHSDIQK